MRSCGVGYWLADKRLRLQERADERKARVVEMKFFAGMTNQEAAMALGISDATVERDWKLARAWLINAVGGTAGPER